MLIDAACGHEDAEGAEEKGGGGGSDNSASSTRPASESHVQGDGSAAPGGEGGFMGPVVACVALVTILLAAGYVATRYYSRRAEAVGACGGRRGAAGRSTPRSAPQCPVPTLPACCVTAARRRCSGDEAGATAVKGLQRLLRGPQPAGLPALPATPATPATHRTVPSSDRNRRL